MVEIYRTVNIVARNFFPNMCNPLTPNKCPKQMRRCVEDEQTVSSRDLSTDEKKRGCLNGQHVEESFSSISLFNAQV